MTQPVVPYAPTLVRAYLVPKLGLDVRVATKVPAQMPEALVTITTASTGGGTDSLALSPRRLIVQVHHADEVACGELAEQVLAHLLDARGGGIRRVTVVGTPARFDDPDTDRPRFQFVVDVLLRARF